mgnify:CR=1 FL=1
MLSGVFAKQNSLFSAERSRPKYWSTFDPKAGFKPPFLSRVFGLPFDSTLHGVLLAPPRNEDFYSSDFYKMVAEGNAPPFDVLVTNPPYSEVP